MVRRSFRQWGQLMVGAVLAAVAVGICWSMLGGWVDRSAAAIAWAALLAAVSWAVFLRPCVRLDERGVEPVFYTHLDVYKRQWRARSAKGGNASPPAAANSRAVRSRASSRTCRSSSWAATARNASCLLYTSRCV